MSAAISRSYKRHLSAADKRAKVIIEACVAAGAGIDFLPDAPNFRFTPAEWSRDPYKGREDCKPSGRGSIACGRGNVLKLKNWAPTRLDCNPQYTVPMKGDSPALQNARYQWAANGNPQPLRDYLRAQAEYDRLQNKLFEEELVGEAA